MSYEIVEAMLARRGVRIDAIAAIVYRLQKGYHPELTMDDCVTSVKSVLQKREVQYTLYTGIALDELAEKNSCPNRYKLLWKRMNPCMEWTRLWLLALLMCMV